MTPGRLARLDALRVALIGGVVVFHATRPFDPFDYYVKADAEVEALAPAVLFVGLWGMPLFFVLAGVAAWHSLRRRGAAAFARERAARLLVPFVAGVVLLVPPQVHVRRLAEGESSSYLDTLSRFFDVGWRWELPLPLEGELFEPAHLWFLGYLFVFTLLLLPLLLRLSRASGAVLLDRLEARPFACAAALGLAVVMVEALLGTEDAGGWNRFGYPCFLMLGFVLAARPALAARLSARWVWLAGVGALGFAVLAAAGAVLHDRLGDALLSGGAPEAVLWRGGKAAVGSLLVLALAGLALGKLGARSAPRAPSARAAYAREAVLPVYLLHQTVAVVLGWWVLSWPLAPVLQWLALTLLTVTTTLALYDVLRRPAWTRRLLGLRALAPSAARPLPYPATRWRSEASRL